MFLQHSVMGWESSPEGGAVCLPDICRCGGSCWPGAILWIGNDIMGIGWLVERNGRCFSRKERRINSDLILVFMYEGLYCGIVSGSFKCQVKTYSLKNDSNERKISENSRANITGSDLSFFPMSFAFSHGHVFC